MISKRVFFSSLWSFLLAFLPLGVLAQGQYLNKLPNNTVNAVVEDHDGFLWIGTSNGLSRFNGYNYLTYYAENSANVLVNDNILDLMTDAQGTVWISTECGLCSFSNGLFHHPEATSFNLKFRLMDVDEQTLLAADRQGVVLIDKETLREIRSYPISREQQLFMYMKPETQQIWVANPLPSREGTEFFIFDTHLNLLRTKMTDGVMTDMESDSSGKLWMLQDGALACFDTNTSLPVSLPESLAKLCHNNKVEFLSISKDDSFVLGIRGQGVYRYDLETQKVEPFISHHLGDDMSWVAYQSSKGTLWLSNTKNFFQGFPRTNHYQSVQLNDYVLTIYPDHQHHLWLRSNDRLYRMNPATQEVSVVKSGAIGEFLIDDDDRMYLINRSNHLTVYDIKGRDLVLREDYVTSASILSVCQDAQKRIWLAGPKSLGMIDESGELIVLSTPNNATITGLYEAEPAHELMLTTEDGKVYRLQGNQFEPFEIPVKNPSAFYFDAKTSDMIIGSYNEGAVFYNVETGKTRAFTNEDNLGDNHVKTILTDGDGNIWFGGATSISRMCLADSVIIQIHDSNHSGGLLYAGSCIDENNTLYFAGNGGLTIVHPDQLEQDDALSSVKIMLESIGVNGETFDHVRQDSFHFNYKQNMLLFRFIAIDLENGDHIRYEYMLEGHDTRWISSGAARRASYSQLPPGNYVFRVRARMSNGAWSENELVVPVIISPAPWNTAWAKCIYVLLLIAGCMVSMRLLVRRRLMEERLQLSHKREQMKQEHIDFMTNLSHEIRTPLMLIYAPLKELGKDTTIGEQNRSLIQLMLHNAEKMKHMVGRIMTTDKPDAQEHLHVAENRLDYLIYSLVDNFRFVTAAKQLHLRIGEVTPEAKGWYDAEKVEKILCNFLSNAIKYTPAGGEIIVDLQVIDDKVHISVTDDGPGIPKDKQYKMFDRYERLGMDNNMPQASGHGIGLNYSLFLAHLHKGDIVYRLREPHGSVITLIVPIVKSAYAEEELSDMADVLVWDEHTLQPDLGNSEGEKEKTILVAEDNPNVMKYLQHLLSTEYNVVLAPDGEEALEAMQIRIPDLVITDVVMPHKDGFELCREMKQDESLQLIPVLMLTAKSDQKNHLHGLESGADAFLAKPFDPEILLATVRNMLNIKGKLQYLLRNTTSQTLTDLPTTDTSDANGQPMLTERDRKFMESLYNAIDAHLGENEFNVNELARELLISYSLLYNKVKGLTGETPQHFLTTYRMNRAMEMLKSKKYTVSEVCYQVGSSSPANFSKAFKKQFGIAPSSVLQ